MFWFVAVSFYSSVITFACLIAPWCWWSNTRLHQQRSRSQEETSTFVLVLAGVVCWLLPAATVNCVVKTGTAFAYELGHLR